jgi:hypothetical protein
MINPAIELDFENGQVEGVLLAATYEVQIPPGVNTGTLGRLVRIVLASDTRKVQLTPTSSFGNLVQLQDLGAVV